MTQSNTTIADALRELPEEGAVRLLTFLGGDGRESRRIEIAHRKLGEQPTLARRERRSHVLHDTATAIDYVKAFGGQETVLLAHGSVVDIVLGEEQVQEDAEVLTLQLQEHPSWAPWRKAAGQWTTVQALGDLIAANRRAIREPNARGLMMAMSGVRGSVSVEMQATPRGATRSTVNAIVVRSKVTGSESAAAEGIDLPETIVIEVPLYLGRPARRVEIDLQLAAERDGTVQARLIAAGVVEAEQAEAEAVVAELRAGLEGVTTHVGLGQVAHAPWRIVKDR